MQKIRPIDQGNNQCFTVLYRRIYLDWEIKCEEIQPRGRYPNSLNNAHLKNKARYIRGYITEDKLLFRMLIIKMHDPIILQRTSCLVVSPYTV